MIVPTRDNAADLGCFVASLRELADIPESVEIIVVDNGGGEEAARALRHLAATQAIRLVAFQEPFNWARLNNRMAKLTDAELLLFANDDMRMVSKAWDARLASSPQDVGVVGARLLYEDDTLQHAGVLFGWKSSVIHDGLFEPVANPGPAERWRVSRAAAAVTGAFLGTRRDLFRQLGGFDEAELPVA